MNIKSVQMPGAFGKSCISCHCELKCVSTLRTMFGVSNQNNV